MILLLGLIFLLQLIYSSLTLKIAVVGTGITIITTSLKDYVLIIVDYLFQGPTGLLFTIKILSNNNVPVKEIDLYESRVDPRLSLDHRSFAIGINDRSIHSLKYDNDGLFDYLKNHSFSTIKKSTIFRDNTKYSNEPRIKYMTTQPLLTRGLLNWIDRVAPTSKCKLTTYFKTKVISIDSLNGLLYSTTDENVLEVIGKQYDLIVGADGARSVVRQSILLQPNITYEGYYTNARWKFIPLDGHDYVNDSAFFTYKGLQGGWWYMPTGKVHLVVFWRANNNNELMNPPSIKSIEDTKEFLQSLFSHPIDDLEKLSNDFYNGISSGEPIFKLSRYHKQFGRVALIGDAAHAMSSALGQGMSCGFEDVISLYNNLDKHKWSSIPDALEDYSNERVSEGNAITDLNFIVVNKRWAILFQLIQVFLKKYLPKFEALFDRINNFKYKYKDILKRYKFWVNKGLDIIKKERNQRLANF